MEGIEGKENEGESREGKRRAGNGTEEKERKEKMGKERKRRKWKATLTQNISKTYIDTCFLQSEQVLKI